MTKRQKARLVRSTYRAVLPKKRCGTCDHFRRDSARSMICGLVEASKLSHYINKCGVCDLWETRT